MAEITAALAEGVQFAVGLLLEFADPDDTATQRFALELEDTLCVTLDPSAERRWPPPPVVALQPDADEQAAEPGAHQVALSKKAEALAAIEVYGNKTRAARGLRISRSTLYLRLAA